MVKVEGISIPGVRRETAVDMEVNTFSVGCKESFFRRCVSLSERGVPFQRASMSGFEL